MSSLRPLFAAALAAVVGTSAFGAPIFVNFTNGSTAAASASDKNNSIRFSETGTITLNDQAGVPTAVQLAQAGISGGNDGAPSVTGDAAAAGIDAAAAGKLHNTAGGGTGTYTFSGLDPLMNYSFTVFGSVSRGQTRSTRYTLLDTGVVQEFGDIVVSTPTGQNLSEVVVLDDVLGNTGSLSLSFANAPINSNSNFGYINAVRIDSSPVPEPASLALLGAGGVCLLARRRNRG